MDEDINIINTNTRNEKIKNFFLNNKKVIISSLLFVTIIVIGIFSFSEFQKKKRIEISNSFNETVIDFTNENKSQTLESLINIINEKDETYSPLSLYFIIDNNLTNDRKVINDLFNSLIEKTKLQNEIKNLIIYKKALYNADYFSEKELLAATNPIINSESVWKAHTLYLLAEFFYSKEEKQKSKEFFNAILNTKNANEEIVIAAQKRLTRDLGE